MATTQVDTLGSVKGIDYSPQRRNILLGDGTSLEAIQHAVATTSLYQILTPGGPAVFITTLGTTFSIASTTDMVVDMWRAPGVTAGTDDVWIMYGSDAAAGTTVSIAHAIYTYSTNNWNFDNTGTAVATVGLANSQTVSVVWNGSFLIAAWRDGSSPWRVEISWTSTRNGSAGWVAAVQLSANASTSGSHYNPILLHDPQLAGGVGATIAIYPNDTSGTHSDQLTSRVLLDTAASPAVANWSSEVMAPESARNFGAAQVSACVDPATGTVHVVSGDSNATVGVYYNKVTVTSAGVATWAARVLVDGQTGGLYTVGVCVDVRSRIYVYLQAGTVGTAGTVGVRTADSPYTSFGSLQTTGGNTTGDCLPHVPSNGIAIAGFVPLLFQRGTASFTAQFDNGFAAQNLEMVPAPLPHTLFDPAPNGGSIAQNLGAQKAFWQAWHPWVPLAPVSPPPPTTIGPPYLLPYTINRPGVLDLQLDKQLQQSIPLPPLFPVSSTIPLALAGSFSGVSGASATALVAEALTSQATGSVANVSATMLEAVAVSGPSTGVSVETGTLLEAVALSGPQTGVSTQTGTLLEAVALSGAAAGVSAESATLLVAVALAGSFSGVSSFAGNLTTGALIALAGSTSGISTETGTLLEAVALTGTAVGVSSESAALNEAVALAGTFSGVSSVTGNAQFLTGTQIAGTSGGASVFSGTLTMAVAMSGSSQSPTQIAATLLMAIAIAGASNSPAQLSGNLQLLAGTPISGASPGVSRWTAALSVGIALAASPSSVGSFGATAAIAAQLSGVATGVSSFVCVNVQPAPTYLILQAFARSGVEPAKARSGVQTVLSRDGSASARD